MARRLLLNFIAVVLITVLAMVWATTSTINSTFSDFRGVHLDAHLHHVPHELFLYYHKNETWDGIDETVDKLSLSLNMDVALVDANKEIVTATSSEITTIALAQDEDLADFTIPLKQESEVVGTAYFKSSSLLRQRDGEFLQRLFTSALWVGLVVGLLAMLVSYVVARNFSKPIVQLGNAASAVERGNYDVQVDVARSDEIGRLGNAFNQMASEIGKLESVRRNLVLNVSHDLRTPLTVVRGYLEGLRSGKIMDRRSAERAFDVMHGEVENLIKLIDSLNEVAALDSGEIPLDLASVDIGYLVNHAAERIRPSADLKMIEIEATIADIEETKDGTAQANPVQLDADKMGQALYNLLDNAVHYTPPNGLIQITGAVIDNQVHLTVADNGEGIPAEHQPFVFERFYRADQARNRQISGYGMGLSIVRSIVHAHGGKVDVGSSGISGEGTRITIQIPDSVPRSTQPA